MVFRVVLVDHAERDIEDIHGYIARYDSVARADRLLDALEKLCNILAELPERGNAPMELSDLGITEYREVRYKPYRVIYRIVGDEVVILCVIDGRRDIESLLQRRLFR